MENLMYVSYKSQTLLIFPLLLIKEITVEL